MTDEKTKEKETYVLQAPLLPNTKLRTWWERRIAQKIKLLGENSVNVAEEVRAILTEKMLKEEGKE